MLISLTAIACGGDDEGAAREEKATGGPSGAASGAVETGRYAITSEIDLTAIDEWKEATSASLKPVADLTANPAQTFLDDLGASSPIVAALKDKLPDVVETKLVGWINEKVSGASSFAAVLQSLTAMLGKFQVLSTLDLEGGSAKHVVTGVAMRQGDDDILVDAPELLGGIKPAENVLVKWKGAEASLGGHSLSLPIGDLGAKGLDLLNTDKLAKTGLKFVLTRVVKCDDIAKSVATKCVGPICVGHEDQLEQLCDKGLDAVVDLTLAGMKKLHIDPLKLAGGDVKLIDAIVPGDAGAISGVWKGAVDLGKGERAITSVFKGRKL